MKGALSRLTLFSFFLLLVSGCAVLRIGRIPPEEVSRREVEAGRPWKAICILEREITREQRRKGVGPLLEMGPLSPRIHLSLARAYRAAGLMGRALEQYQLALSGEPIQGRKAIEVEMAECMEAVLPGDLVGTANQGIQGWMEAMRVYESALGIPGRFSPGASREGIIGVVLDLKDPITRRALMGLARCYSGLGIWDDVSYIYERLLPDSSGQEMVKLSLLYSKALRAKGERKKALEAYRKAIDLAAGLGDMESVGSGYVGLSGTLIEMNRIDEAISVLEDGRRKFRRTIASGKAGMALVDALVAKGEYIKARDVFREVTGELLSVAEEAERLGKKELAARARFAIGECYVYESEEGTRGLAPTIVTRWEYYPDAIAVYDYVARSYPDTEWAEKALYMMGYLMEEDPSRAVEVYSNLVHLFPNSNYAFWALIRLANIYPTAGGKDRPRIWRVFVEQAVRVPPGRWSQFCEALIQRTTMRRALPVPGIVKGRRPRPERSDLISIPGGIGDIDLASISRFNPFRGMTRPKGGQISLESALDMIRSGRMSVEAMIGMGDSFAMDGRVKEAFQVYDLLSREYPERMLVLKGKEVWLSIESGDLEKARSLVDEMVKAGGPGLPEILMQLADSCRGRVTRRWGEGGSRIVLVERMGIAKEIMERVGGLRPDLLPSILHRLALASLMRGDMTSFEGLRDELISRYPLSDEAMALKKGNLW
jgi:tetratricopeptide (TPR) repeat protein